MILDVALTPALLANSNQMVCIVVDVLRASSACVAMFDSGATSVAVAETPDQARELRRGSFPDALLCGEVGGLPPEGFDYGNSPVEFGGLDLTGRSLVLATSNGTRALHAVADASEVLVGCLLNRAACIEAATESAQHFSAGVLILCAGNGYGTAFSLDDAFAAGAMVNLMRRNLGGTSTVECTDAAEMSERLFLSFGGDGGEAFGSSSHGRLLANLGFTADLERCACLDVSSSVPVLGRDPQGYLLLHERAAG